jgi:hypothetical protein
MVSRKRKRSHLRKARRERMMTTLSMKKVRRKKSMKTRKITKKRRNMRMSRQKRRETSKKKNLNSWAMARRKRTRRTVSIGWSLPPVTSKERYSFKDSHRKRLRATLSKRSLTRISQDSETSSK